MSADTVAEVDRPAAGDSFGGARSSPLAGWRLTRGGAGVPMPQGRSQCSQRADGRHFLIGESSSLPGKGSGKELKMTSPSTSFSFCGRRTRPRPRDNIRLFRSSARHRGCAPPWRGAAAAGAHRSDLQSGQPRRRLHRYDAGELPHLRRGNRRPRGFRTQRPCPWRRPPRSQSVEGVAGRGGAWPRRGDDRCLCPRRLHQDPSRRQHELRRRPAGVVDRRHRRTGARLAEVVEAAPLRRSPMSSVPRCRRPEARPERTTSSVTAPEDAIDTIGRPSPPLPSAIWKRPSARSVGLVVQPLEESSSRAREQYRL